MNNTQHRPIITTTGITNTNLSTLKHNKGCIQRVHLKICAERLFMECDKSSQNHLLPMIPVAASNIMKKHWVAIVDIAAKGVYFGVKYGYDDTEKLHEISACLKHNLHDDMIRIIVEYTMELTIKELILEPFEFMNIIDNYQIDMTKYNQWVTNIEINDFEDDLQQIIKKYEFNEIEQKRIKECFNENNVNYKYLEDHTRGEFVQLLRSNPCNISIGKGTKIYSEFSQHAEIIIRYPFTSNSI